MCIFVYRKDIYMKSVKIIVAFLIFSILMIVSVSASDISGTLSNGIDWTLYGWGELVIDGEGEIPDVGIGEDSELRNYASQIYDITICEGITRIGNYAFFEFVNLKSVNLNNGLLSIGHNAFNGCTSLESISIPDSVVSIGSSSFKNCSSLLTASLSVNMKTVPASAFAYCSRLMEVHIPEGITEIGFNAFGCCTMLEYADLPESLKKISSSAFDACTSLEYVTMGDAVEMIGAYAFYACVSLKNIDVSDGLLNVGSQAFLGCSSLSSIEIPETVKAIGSNTFYSCDSVTLHVKKNSFAHTYAKNNNIDFEYIVPGNIDGVGTTDEDDVYFLASNLLTGLSGLSDNQIHKANLYEDYDEFDMPIIDIKDLIKLAQIVVNR